MTTAKIHKQFNSLDDRGIFCTEVNANDISLTALSSDHCHNNIEIIYSVSAHIDISTGIDNFSISKGDLIVISPMESHSQSIVGEGLYYSIKFLPSILFSSDQTPSEYKFFNRFISLEGRKRHYSKKELDSTDINDAIGDIMREWTNKSPGYELMIRAHILKIFTSLSRCENSLGGIEQSKLPSHAMTDVLSYISENIATVTEQDAAKHSGLSLAYFSTHFKNEIGIKFSEHLMQLKINRAKGLLLSTDKSITYIAYETGFASASHFIARFREIEGITPAKFRRRAQTEGSVSKIKAPAFTAIFPCVGEESGHLLVFKYRTNRIDDPADVPLFVSTQRRFPISDDLSWTTMTADEMWHVIIMDLDRSKQYVKSFLPSKNGKFYGGHVHFHLFYKLRSPEQYVDLAYVTYAKSLDDALSLIGCDEDINYGYFEDTGYSRWETISLEYPTKNSSSAHKKDFFRDARGLFADAGANGISLRKIELLDEDGMEFTRIWCP